MQVTHKRLVYKLMAIVLGAFIFSWALVPLYDVLCQVTGLNGKTRNVAESYTGVSDNKRWVTVQFVTTVMRGLGWNFYPKTASVRVHPGQVETVIFVAKNIGPTAIQGQAIPSVTPGAAVSYFKKIECFCFKQQTLQAGEQKEMPLRFFVSQSLPADIKDITLSYAFFPTH